MGVLRVGEVFGPLKVGVLRVGEVRVALRVASCHCCTDTEDLSISAGEVRLNSNVGVGDNRLPYRGERRCCAMIWLASEGVVGKVKWWEPRGEVGKGERLRGSPKGDTGHRGVGKME